MKYKATYIQVTRRRAGGSDCSIWRDSCAELPEEPSQLPVRQPRGYCRRGHANTQVQVGGAFRTSLKAFPKASNTDIQVQEKAC